MKETTTEGPNNSKPNEKIFDVSTNPASFDLGTDAHF